MPHVTFAGNSPSSIPISDRFTAGLLDSDDFALRDSKRELAADAVVVIDPDSASSYFHAALVVEKIIDPNFKNTPIIYQVAEGAPKPKAFELLEHLKANGVLGQTAEDFFEIAHDETDVLRILHQHLDQGGPAKADTPPQSRDIGPAEQKVMDDINQRGADKEEGEFKIAVFMSASTKDPEKLALARTLGNMVGEAGWSAVYGASNVGAMNEFGKGVHESGGHLSGVTVPWLLGQLIPGAVDPTGRGGEKLDADGLNRLDALAVVEDTKVRVKDQLKMSDALVVLEGGIGTFEELAYVLELKRAEPETYGDKAVVIVNRDGFWDPAIEMLKADGFDPKTDFVSVTDEAGLKAALIDHADAMGKPTRPAFENAPARKSPGPDLSPS